MFLENLTGSGTLQPLLEPPIHLLRDASLFLDFDGTLVEIAERPDAVKVDARVHKLLRVLSDRLDGRVVLISGRGAAEVGALVGAGTMTVVGSHGLEFHWRDGSVETVERPAALAGALATMREFAAGTPGLLVEDKPFGAALHFRMAPDAESPCVALAMRLAEDLGLALQYGRMVVELRPDAGDKGRAIRRLMRDPAFAGTSPVFLGDDMTDEPGFLAAQALGGAGVLIGPKRPSAAIYRIGTVAETLNWLEAACGGVA